MADLLSDVWDPVARRIQEARHLLVLLDYDGTLVPIVDRPDRVILPPQTREAVRTLRDLPTVGIGIVSGRSMRDVVSQVSLEGLWYVGNHGYEIRTPDAEDIHFYEAKDMGSLDAIREEIRARTSHLSGVLLESKGPILALHYRQVESSRVAEVERLFYEVAERHRHAILVSHGKCVLEARLRAPCTKGTAVRFIRRRAPAGCLPIYFGDDRTDFDAFRELREVGITIAVGDISAHLAHYTLPSPIEVVDTLTKIVHARAPGTVPRGTA
jgi:trehalose 6-phosphate phosphatase